jgi:hypothetical protein
MTSDRCTDVMGFNEIASAGHDPEEHSLGLDPRGKSVFHANEFVRRRSTKDQIMMRFYLIAS